MIVFADQNFVSQVILLIWLSLIYIIFVGAVRPYSSSFMNKIELFNEFITLLILYLVMTFSDFVLNLNRRNSIGLFYIFVVCIYGSVHMFFLLKNTY